MSKQMLILRCLTHISSGSSYKIAGRALPRIVFITKEFAKMSTATAATNGDPPYKSRFVDVSTHIIKSLWSQY